jgi:hypothetical protein
MSGREVSTSVVKCSEGLSNRVSINVIRHINNVKFAAYTAVSLSHSFIFFWFYCILLYIWLYVLYVLCSVL